MHTLEELKEKQCLPLDIKIQLTIARVRAWVHEYGESGVYISFSGGKDSTVLMDIIRNKMGYDLPAVFVNVPTQYPELKSFAQTWDNVEILQPKLSFYDICEQFGFPLISKEVSLYISQCQKPLTEKNLKTRNLRLYGIRSDGVKVKVGKIPEKYKFLIDAPFKVSNYCCDALKKAPLHTFTKNNSMYPITAQMADESRIRERIWLKHGCNIFDSKSPISNPMSFWTEKDVLQYIKENNIKICSVYGEIVEEDGQLKTTKCDRSGCMLCGFGCQNKGDERFLMLKQTHAKMYNLLDIVKNNGVTFREAIEWTNENGNLNIKL